MAKASQFLQLKDDNNQPVLGESIDDDHYQWIDLNSWSWSVKDPAALPPESGDTTSGADYKTKIKPKSDDEGEADAHMNPTLLSVSKKIDRSTWRLIKAMDTGEVFKTATLVIMEEFKESPSPFYMEIVLTDVFVVKLDLSVNAGSAGVEFKESLDLTYSNIEFGYQVRGGKQQGKMFQSFDRSRDCGATTSKKAKQTAAEKVAEKKKDYEAMKKFDRKTGG